MKNKLKNINLKEFESYYFYSLYKVTSIVLKSSLIQVKSKPDLKEK